MRGSQYSHLTVAENVTMNQTAPALHKSHRFHLIVTTPPCSYDFAKEENAVERLNKLPKVNTTDELSDLTFLVLSI